jgi:hypothetical protein
MSIRLIARDLYRLKREVEMLENQFSRSSGEDRDEIKDRLRKVRAERNRMQRILDGAKEPPAYRKPL